MRMPRQLAPITPAVDHVAAPLQLGDSLARKPRLDVQRVARLASAKRPDSQRGRLLRLVWMSRPWSIMFT